MLHACVHKHTCTQKSLLGTQALLQLGTGASLFEMYFFWLKAFSFNISPLLFSSCHHTDPATVPSSPLAFLQQEVNIRYDLSKGQLGTPCRKGHFQCCSSWYKDKTCKSSEWIAYRYIHAHVSKQGSVCYDFITAIQESFIWEKKKKKNKRAKGYAAALFLLHTCLLLYCP